MIQVRVENKSWEHLWTVKVDSTKPLLKQLEVEGIEIPNACNMWMCAACMCSIKSGGEFAVKNLRGEPSFPLWDDEIMTCIWWFAETDTEIILQTLS